MKLLDRTLLMLFLAAFAVVGGASVIQYYSIKGKIESRVDKRLLKEKMLIGQQLEDLNIRTGFSYNTTRSSVEVIDSEEPDNCTDSLFNGTLTDIDGEVISYRILQTCILLENDYFRVQIKKEVEETETFISSLFTSYLIILISVFMVFLAMKFIVLKNIWSPFFTSLSKLKNSDLQRTRTEFDTSVTIREFKDLNLELNEVANRIYLEYQDQTGFVENANHELMTPIAVISNKLELLIQSPKLGEEEVLLVNDILMKLNKISRINKALVLLSKIDHDHFHETEKVGFSEYLDEALNMFEDQIAAKGIKIRKKIEADFKHYINPDLATILTMNVVKNAVMHNKEGGFIDLFITSNSMRIVNQGEPISGDASDMFQRFIKGTDREESTGLGLSIMQKICTSGNLSIEYTVNADQHTVLISA